MEDFASNGLVEMGELPDLNRKYFNSLVELVSQEIGNNSDYHKYHHYVLDRFKETLTEDEKSKLRKEINYREFGSPKTCKFCGCVRRKLKIRTKKVKRVKRKFYILICRFCGKSALINKKGSNLSRITSTEQPEKSTTSELKVQPRIRLKRKRKPKPVIEIETNVVPVIKPQKMEKFNQEDTIKQLNFLLKGGNGGKKLNVNELQKSRLMDLLM